MSTWPSAHLIDGSPSTVLHRHAWSLYQMGFDALVTGRIGGRDVRAGNSLWTPFAGVGATDAIMNNVHGG